MDLNCFCLDLHSTMFLLILAFLFRNSIFLSNLHSTMFLLILDLRTAPGVFLIFTFHNVSINTDSVKAGKHTVIQFTFHNVSINTTCVRCSQKLLQNLHSTMFLLIPILHNPLYYKPNSTIFCQPCHLLYLSNTIFNNIMKIFLFLQ